MLCCGTKFVLHAVMLYAKYLNYLFVGKFVSVKFMKKFTTIDEAVKQVFDKENEDELPTQILDDYGKQILK